MKKKTQNNVLKHIVSYSMRYSLFAKKNKSNFNISCSVEIGKQKFLVAIRKFVVLQ